MDNQEGQAKRKGGSPALAVGIVVVLAVIGGGALGFFLYNADMKTERIADVLADLRNYDGLQVTFEGEVSGVINLLGYKAYTLDDGSGTITVVTERGLPRSGESLKVSGIIHEVFNVAGVNYTVLYEAAKDS